MSQIPPAQPSQPMYQMPPTQSNVWGWVSLICGILSFCTAGVTGLFAIIFGFVGIRRSKVTHTGKGASIAGLLLGLFTSIGWVVFIAFFGGLALFVGKASEPARTANQQFLRDLASGNITAATNDTDGTIATSDLQALIDNVKDLGAFKDATNFSINVPGDTADLMGVATFDKGKKSYTVHEVKKDGAWKISSMTFDQIAPATVVPASEPTTNSTN